MSAASMTSSRGSSPDDYDAFYRGCSTRLAGQLYLLTGDLEEARDCVQEALERAWVRWARVSQLEDPEAWVRTVSRRLSVSRWRRARNATFAWTRVEAPPVRQPDHEQHRVLVQALQSLPTAHRTAVVLHHLCDLDVAAVAAETGVSVSTVTSRLARGRAALHDLLAEDPDPARPGGAT